MALLGSSVDPRLFMQDYSGFTRAAEIQAQGMQNLGAAIGQGIKDFGEAREERKKLDAQVKADDVSIESAIKLGKSLGIDINSYLEPIQALRKDPNTTPAESLALGRAAAQGISNAFTLGIGAQEREIAAQRAKAEAGYKQGMLGAAQTRAAASLFSAKQAAGELKETEISIFDPEIGEERKEKALIDKQGQYYEPDTKRPILNKEKYFYGEEGGLGELPPTSQVGGSASDLIASAAGMPAFTSKTRDQLPPSSVKNRYVSLDFNAASNPNARGIEVIVPDNASPEEFAAAKKYTEATQAYFAKHNVHVPIRGVKTRSQNGRGVGQIIHLEPAFGADKESMAVMQKDPEGYAQVVSDSFAGLPVTVIAPHKQNDPGAVINGISERGLATDVLIPAFGRLDQRRSSQASPDGIDNALSMSGDMTQQAMGTPEQQAVMARMIEEGQGMAMAQNMPQGASPTEPSMATQQPQLPQPQRRMVRGIPTGGNKSGARFRIATPEEAARFGVPAGQIDETTGRFYPVSQPSGNTFTAEIDPKTGKVVFSQGPTKAQQAAEDEAKAEEKAKLTATGLTQDLFELKKRYTDLSAGTGPIPALSRLGASAVPGTPAAGVKEVANRVAQGLTIEKIMSERRSSPSGAFLGGATSDSDRKAIENSVTSLNAVQNPEEFNREWTRIMEAQLNIAHGTPEQRAKLVKENKITEEYNKQIEDLYPAETINIKGELVPRREKSAPNIKSLINPEVQAILDRVSKGQ